MFNYFLFVWSDKMIFIRFYIVRVIIIFHVFLPTDAVSGVIRNVDPIKAYPKGIFFDVKRDGKQVGQHKVQFRQKANGQILVVSRLNITIKVLGMIFYKYAYHCRAWWAENHLIKLLAKQYNLFFYKFLICLVLNLTLLLLCFRLILQILCLHT